MVEVSQNPTASLGDSFKDVISAQLFDRDDPSEHKSLWLFFPSGRAVLWKYYGMPGPLGPASFRSLRASCFRSIEVCTSGAIVLPDGTPWVRFSLAQSW